MNIRILNLVAHLSEKYGIETSIHFDTIRKEFYIDMNTQSKKQLRVYFSNVFDSMIYFVCGESSTKIDEYNLFYTNTVLETTIIDQVKNTIGTEENYNKSYDNLFKKYK